MEAKSREKIIFFKLIIDIPHILGFIGERAQNGGKWSDGIRRPVKKVIRYDSNEIFTKYLNIMIGVEQRGGMKQLWGYISLCVHDLFFKKGLEYQKRKDYDAIVHRR